MSDTHEHGAQSAQPKQCMIQGCTKDMRYGSHGVCRTHYKMLLKMVRAGKTTWKELEDNGITAPATYTRDPRDRELLDNFIKSKLSQ